MMRMRRLGANWTRRVDLTAVRPALHFDERNEGK